MNKNSYIFYIAFLFVASASACARPSITPDVISQQISTLGAKFTLQAIYDDKTMWSQLLAGIATGTKDWLLVATQLHSVADAGATEQLGHTVGEALEHQPENVLSLAVTEFGVATICSGPDVDDARFDSYKLSMAAITKRQNMVRSIRNEALHQWQDSCIALLEKAKTGIARFYGEKEFRQP